MEEQPTQSNPGIINDKELELLTITAIQTLKRNKKNSFKFGTNFT